MSPKKYLVEHVRGAVEGLGAEAEGLVHVQDPVEEDGAHLGVEVPLLLDVRLGGVLRLMWVGDGERERSIPTVGRQTDSPPHHKNTQTPTQTH